MFPLLHTRAASTPIAGAIAAVIIFALTLHVSPVAAQASGGSAPATTRRAAHTAATSGVSDIMAARLDTTVRALMTREHIPGLSVAIARGGVVQWERGYGVADIEQGVPATPTTRYRIASVSKAITVALVLRLVERGLLDLDAPIQRYVPAYPAKRYQVTVRALLAGTSGVRGYRGDEYLSARYYPDLAASLSIFRDDSLLYAPGTGYTETPYGFTLLGLAVESVTRESFMAALREQVLAPAAMLATGVDAVAEIVPHRARPYTLDSAGTIRNAEYIDPSYKIPAGGLVATAGDVARFGAALLDGHVIQPASLTLMTTPVRLADGRTLPLGFGVALGEAGAGLGTRPDAVWLAGLQEGATAVVYLLPPEQLVVAVLTNVNGPLGAGAIGLLKRVANTAAILMTDTRATKARGRPARH